MWKFKKEHQDAVIVFPGSHNQVTVSNINEPRVQKMLSKLLQYHPILEEVSDNPEPIEIPAEDIPAVESDEVDVQSNKGKGNSKKK